MDRLVKFFALITFFWAAPALAQDAFQDHYSRGTALYAGEQYQAALVELQAAYALRQPSRLLFEIARAHRKLGHVHEALQFYKTFVVSESEPEPAMKTEADAMIASLGQLVAKEAPPAAVVAAPAPAQPQSLPEGMFQRYELRPLHYEMHHDRGMIAAGATLLGAGYGAALITGSILVGSNDSPSFDNNGNPLNNGSMRDASGTLLIPVVGPFIAGLVFRQSSWSIPWMFVDGGAQVAGLAMIIAGYRTKHKVPVFGKVHFSPYGGGDGGGLVASGRF